MIANEIPVPNGSSFVISDAGKVIMGIGDSIRVYSDTAGSLDVTLGILKGVKRWQIKQDILDVIQVILVTIARQSFLPTGVQTNFTFNSGYTPGYVDVYVNGVKLVNALDYTAVSGGLISLSKAAVSGDVVEVVAYKAFSVGDPISSVAGNLSVGGNLTATNGTFTGTVSAGVGSFVTQSFTNLSVTGVATFSSNVNIAGTLTYDDVTNIDSLGIVTARKGVRINDGGIIVSGVSTADNIVEVRSDDGTPGRVDLYCEVSNAHYARIQAPPHSDFAGNITLTLPSSTGTLLSNNSATVATDLSIADKIVHTGDTNTSIRFPTADTITAETAGTERLL